MALDGNDLGDALKAAVDAELSNLNQDSNPANSDQYRTNMWRAIGNAWVDYIKNNATIESLSCNQTTAGDPPHTHNVSTVESTGKIK